MTETSEQQQIEFYKQVAAKYRPRDNQEVQIVYDIFAFLWTNRRMREFHTNDAEKRRFAANLSLIAKLEQRLAFLQANWPKREEERTQQQSLHLVEKKETPSKTKRKQREIIG